MASVWLRRRDGRPSNCPVFSLGLASGRCTRPSLAVLRSVGEIATSPRHQAGGTSNAADYATAVAVRSSPMRLSVP